MWLRGYNKEMSEDGENTNLLPNGKRRLSRRLGLTNPAKRGDQLWTESQERANEVPPTVRPSVKSGVKQTDLPLDAADRAEESLRKQSEIKTN